MWWALLVLLCVLPAQAAEPLVLERTIPLHDVSGRIDHMAVDLKRSRLVIAELGNNSADVLDIERGSVVHRIEGLHEPQGVGYAPAADLILIANAGDGTVQFFTAKDFAPAGSIALGDDADNIRLDPRDGFAVVGYGAGGLAIIDPSTRKKVRDIRLPAHPEGFQIDPGTNRAYVNIPDAHEIAVVDLGAGRILTTWPTRGLRANFPMGLDVSRSLLASVFRAPAILLLLDSGSGAERARLPACGDADDIFFDVHRMRIYVSCGAGEVLVFQQRQATWERLAPIHTNSGARTSLFVPNLDRLFVAERAGLLGSEAAIRVYRPGS